MRRCIAWIRRWCSRDAANTAVEYSVMLALILLICLAAVRTLGCNVQSTVSNAARSIGS